MIFYFNTFCIKMPYILLVSDRENDRFCIDLMIDVRHLSYQR
jgi:hypothetical protein